MARRVPDESKRCSEDELTEEDQRIVSLASPMGYLLRRPFENSLSSPPGEMLLNLYPDSRHEKVKACIAGHYRNHRNHYCISVPHQVALLNVRQETRSQQRRGNQPARRSISPETSRIAVC